MRLKLNWRRHPSDQTYIVGICPELPDHFCNFSIQRIQEGRFKASLAGMNTDNFTKAFVFRDADVARTFCEDFLNNNTVEIIRNQIYEMKRRSMKGDKPVSYYEKMLSLEQGTL